jgi:hypothetical protein
LIVLGLWSNSVLCLVVRYFGLNCYSIAFPSISHSFLTVVFWKFLCCFHSPRAQADGSGSSLVIRGLIQADSLRRQILDHNKIQGNFDMKLTSLNFVRVHVSTSSSLDDLIPLANAVTVSVSSTGGCKPISAEPSSFHTTQAIFAVALQPARQLHTSEICHTDSGARQSTNHAVHQSAESQVSSNTSPTAWKLSGGVPPHAELQRQRVANNDPRGRLARDAVRSCGCNRSWRHRLRRRVHKHIHACSNVQVAELQRTGQRDYHWRVDLTQAALAIGILCCSLLELIFQCAGRERLRGYAAGQGSVVVDVELQQVEERVVDKVDCAVDVLLYAEEKLERAAGFVAGREWNVGKLACSVGDVFASVTDLLSVRYSN